CLTHCSLFGSLPLERRAITWRGREGLIVVGDGKAPSQITGRGDGLQSLGRRGGRRKGGRLAYAIYTSGSTGRPKAALLTQLGLANLIAAQRPLLRLRPGRRVLQFASLAFDAAVWEIFAALTSGATLVLADSRDLLPGECLRRTIERERIDTLTLPPSVLAMLGSPDLPELKTLILAGEACSAALASQWSAGRQVINAYGPTEATVCATAYECPCGEQPAPPLGNALAGVELLVLDRQLRPAEPGQAGELCIAGIGLARGYLNRPELTAEKFIQHPLVCHHDSRLYRTGDLVRRRSDGQLEFLGRIDRQVKVRGVRIEPDEVSAAMERHPAVQAAATLVTRHQTVVRLASFAIPRPGADLSVSSLRPWLHAQLPAAMVPSSLTLVERWPLLPNGKLDEQALLSFARLDNRSETTPPESATADVLDLVTSQVGAAQHGRNSRELCREVGGIYQRLLNTSPVVPNDDFFELGGDSLQAMELLMLVEQRFGRRLSIAQFLGNSTVGALARLLAGARPSEDATLVPLQARGTRPPLFLVHPAGGSVICYRHLARELGHDQPCYGLQSPALVAEGLAATSIEAMADRYLNDLLRARPRGPYLLVGWSLGGLVAYEMAHRLRQTGRAAPLLVLIDSGVLFSFQLLRQFVPTGDVPAFMWSQADRERMYARLRRHEGQVLIPASTDEALARRTFDVFWANVEAAYHYSPPDYAGEVTLIVGDEAGGKYHPLNEWRRRCQAVHVYEVPGKHLEILQPPCVGRLAAIINSLADKLTVNRRFHVAARPLAPPAAQVEPITLACPLETVV
ncbi:MAG TPA: alpha/beta fold hydrolase, partial [Pirellulales bacterium]|nr:alpha/beta fold hydrolase [Pirellulales bacterium]